MDNGIVIEDLTKTFGRFGIVSNTCNHAGGPLGDGRLDGEYVTCPWHNWKFHRCTGLGEPGFEEDAVFETINALQREVVDLCLDVESAVARELRRDLEHAGVRLPQSISDSGIWRNVFARKRGKLPPGAASIVKDGVASPVFRAIE